MSQLALQRRFQMVAMLIASATLLQGCQLLPSPPLVATHKGRPAANRSHTVTRHAPPVVSPEGETVNTAAADLPKEPPREPSDDAESPVVGMDAKQIEAILGPPTSRENRGPGKTWRYRDGKCVASLSLFPDVETRDYHILAYEVTHDDNTADGKRLCLGEFRTRLRAKQIGARGE